MDNFTPNGVTRRLLQVGNGRCKEETRSATYGGNPSHDLKSETVAKSRSSDCYSMSLSDDEKIDNNNYYPNEYFPKSMTSNILAPRMFKIQPYFDNRLLRSEILSSVKWPNSIEDQERETTKSSSNPAISSSISEEEYGDKKRFCEGTLPSKSKKQQYLHVPDQSSCPESIGNSSGSNNNTIPPSDSLPHHRERLSQYRKNFMKAKHQSSLRVERADRGAENIEKNKSSPSMLYAVYNAQDLDVKPEKLTPFSTMTKSRDLSATDINRPRDLKLCNQERNAASLANVGSWLANQSFDYIDSCYTLQSRSSMSPRYQDYHRRTDEICFESPTARDITFNVSGQYYRIDPKVLSRFPNTMLGNQEKRAKYWDSLRKEYFLDRHRATFEVVIDYYLKDGKLTRPDDIPIDIFIHELKFYHLDRDNLHNFLLSEGILLVVKEKPMPKTKVKRFIWNLFEDPESCTIARVVTTMSALVIALSVIVFCMETVPDFHSLGEESLQHIQPALNSCENALQNRSDLFQPEGNLFARATFENSKHEDIREPPSFENHDTISKSEFMKVMTESDPRKHKEGHDITGRTSVNEEAEKVGITDETTFDNFDGKTIVSTMQRTLSICAEEREMDLLNKYTLLRCKVELDDAFSTDETPIVHIFQEVEVHEHGHDDEEESDDDDHHEENDNKRNKKREKAMKKKRKNRHERQKNESQTTETDSNKRKKRKKNRKNQNHGEDIVNPKDVKLNKETKRSVTVKNETKLLTLKQTIRGLNQLCSELDKHSIRSSYAWFVLEATIGGPAGQLFLIESGCIVWFVIEIILRFYSCPSKIKFCTNFLNIVDAVAIMPYFITLIVTSLHTDSNLRPQTATILRTIRLVRMLRILKLSRHSRGLRILGLTLVRSTRVLVLLVCFQMVLAVTFSSIVYYVEYDAEGSQFKSIPGSFWWAIITMTTVGYGDVVPITTWGRITGAFCAIMGILGIAFPVPVIVSNFNYLYNLDSDACKLTPEELMGETEENDRNNNVEKFQENLFDAVRRNVGSMTTGAQEGQPTGQNPAELWNYTRRQYHSGDKNKPTKVQNQPKPNKIAKELIAMATASALTVSLPESTAISSRQSKRRKAQSL
uniref:uncharacterized protein LOC120329455 isoform X1 n=1 Tax=Styela clava TaxID=7725 RepID=UPI0019398F97|nr:uncharacterized protein LOC120329455 isoform X1 [Styela clava]